jgi:hypothetical protein
MKESRVLKEEKLGINGCVGGQFCAEVSVGFDLVTRKSDHQNEKYDPRVIQRNDAEESADIERFEIRVPAPGIDQNPADQKT